MPTMKKGFRQSWVDNWQLYLLALPIIVWLLLYAYKPMGGLIIAFEKFSPFKGIFESDFVGFGNFERLIGGPGAYLFWRAFFNTISISLYGLVFGFPVPIILAIAYNESKQGILRNSVQTLSYLPHLISEVTIASIILTMLSLNGVVNSIIDSFGDLIGLDFQRISWMSEPAYFQGIYIATGIWKEAGFSSIVFFAALVGVSPTLYEAAKIDGASRFQCIRHVSIPSIMPTIVIMLIIRLGNILNVGFERIILLYNPQTFATADILGSYTFRLGSFPPIDYGLSTAASLFNSAIGFTLVIITNRIARKLSETSLW